MNKQSSRLFPSIWKRFERTINGTVKKFWVQDLDDDYMEIALDYLCEYFVKDEPVCQATRAIEDEESMKYARDFWEGTLKQNCSLACFTTLENGEKKLVAVNCCLKKSIADSSEKRTNARGRSITAVLQTFDYVSKLKNPFEEFGIHTYLGAMGLVTIPEYRGHNIGLELLLSRKFLCAVLGLKATMTLFTSPASQKLAEKAGFKELVSVTFDEIEKNNPSLKLPNICSFSNCIKHMYILYE